MKSDKGTFNETDPYPGTFLHAVIRDDPVAQHNLQTCGQLWSPDYVAMSDSGLAAGHQSLRDTPLDDLKRSGPTGVYSPFASWRVWAAAIVRSGGRVGVGTINTAWYSLIEAEKVLHDGDVELALEHARRRLNPNAASRLTSLYVTEDTDMGRKNLMDMFRGGPEREVIRVRIPAVIRVTRCDTTWFERFHNKGGDENLKKYWSGAAVNIETPRWEFLVEGLIERISS